jgi:DNA-binding CsgD family transcriptional regulator
MRVSLEEFSAVVTAIHMAAASPERWPDAVSAMSRFVRSSQIDTGDITIPQRRAEDTKSGSDQSAFTQSVMQLLAAHVETAKKLHSSFAVSGQVAIASLDRLAVAAIVVDRDGTVHHCNAAAKSLLNDDSCCIRVVNSRVRLKAQRMNKSFDAAVQRATQPAARSTILPVPSRGNEVLEMTVSPLLDRNAQPFAWPFSLALVMVATPCSDAERIVQRVRLLYALTEAEARVMALLALGATVHCIAAEHGVRVSTVRAQVRTIFQKTGVNRQTDLVRLALTGTPIVSGNLDF